MEELITLPFRYFWVIQIVGGIVAAWQMWMKEQGNIRENPQLAPYYRMLAIGNAFWISVPPAIMGLGILKGGIPHMFYFFRPSDNDPYVLSYWLSMFLVDGFILNLWSFVSSRIAMQETRPTSSNQGTEANTPRFKINRLLPSVYLLVAFVALYYFIRVPIEDLPLINK